MVGVPRDIVEHKLSTYKSVQPVVQKKQTMGQERTRAMNEQVMELLYAGIVRQCEY